MLQKIFALMLVPAMVVTQSLALQNPASPEPQTPLVEPNHAEPVAPGVALVKKYTGLKFSLVAPLNSATSKPGDDVQLRLLRPLVVRDTVLLPEGTVVHGRVAEVTPAADMCRNGKIVWEITGIPFADSSFAPAKVQMVSSDPKAEVQYQLPMPVSDHPEWPILAFVIPLTAPLMAAVGVVGAPYFLATYIDDRVQGPPRKKCTARGSESIVPAGSIVGLVITRDHKVRY